MSRPYVCKRRSFATEQAARAFAGRVFERTGVIVAIERKTRRGRK